jgi:hypothetical protein
MASSSATYMNTARTIAVLVGAFLASCISGQGTEKPTGLKKRLTSVEYLRDSVPYGVESHWTTYDEQGRESVVRRKHIDRTISTDSSWYDTASLLVRRTTLNYKENDSTRRFAGVYKYQYDSKGLLQEEIVTTTEDPNGDFGTTTTAYTYSEHNLPSAKTIVDETGAVLRRIEYGYDSEDNVVSEKEYRNGSSLPETWRDFEHDAEKRVVKETRRGGDGEVLFVWTNHYSLDSLGRILTVLQRFDDGRVRMTRESKYDSNGTLVEEVVRRGREMDIIRHSYEYHR